MLPISKPTPSPAAPQAPAPDRRAFLMGVAAIGGGVALGFTLSPAGMRAALAQGAAGPLTNGHIAIDATGKITVWSAHMEMGQGIYTGIASLVAEELDVPLAAITVEGGAGNPRLFGNMAMGGAFQLTGGSTGTPSSWERYRRAGATLRAMLVTAAAQSWGVPAASVTTGGGVLVSGTRRATYAEFAAAAARLPIPTDVTLKAPAAWTVIGREGTGRIEGGEKVTGRQTYTIDLRLPGMLTATIVHPPRFGATVATVDDAAARRIPGVVDVVRVSRGVAVVARDTWAALRGREALRVTWDETQAERRGSAELIAEYTQALGTNGTVAAQRGDAAGALNSASRRVEATYVFPYLAHAALEPLDAVVRRQGDLLEVWGGHQMPDLYQAVAAQIAGLTPDRVKMHVMTTGGGFGRRAVADADIVVEATEIAKAINWRAPVKLMWTRENDMAGGRYRPLYLHRIRAAVGTDGRISAWNHHIVGQSIASGTPFEAMMVRNGVDPTSVEGASDTPYQIPNLRVAVTNTRVGVPVLWWRSVGHTHTAYAVETMMDELAAAAGQDPVAFRLAHLPADARERGVLELAAARANWSTPLPAGRFRGVAVHQSFNSFVAMVVEITMSGGQPKVERVVAAVDCGVPINPDVIRAQIEGGIGFAVGTTLASELTLTAGVVDQRNFDGFQVLRMEDMPVVETHIVPSTASPTGIGEPGVPPLGPALANAVASATGRRVRVLPFAKGMGA